eukprot:TRINITY_DN1919_c0_g1_i2.p1 TRINITY_DN1919_c0_g1~~TRINITY_DN1919_c0_g1_i2.p1  ORF type:complete len:115 (+),score=14.82 TRINITY_DN1919_c0_g1_i2:124-468(+)
MIRRPPRSTQSRSSAASDVYKRQVSTQSTGILTRFPSTTPLGLALGSDSPSAEYRCAGTLGLTAERFFTVLVVTHVSIRTSDTSSNPYESPSQAYRTLLYHTHSRVHPQLRYSA